MKAKTASLSIALLIGISTLVALAETTPVVSVNESVNGFYNEATIDQRFVTSPRARPTDLVN